MFYLEKIEYLKMDKLRLVCKIRRGGILAWVSLCHKTTLFNTFSLSIYYEPDIILDVGNSRMYVKETVPVIPELTVLLERQTSKQMTVSGDQCH